MITHQANRFSDESGAIFLLDIICFSLSTTLNTNTLNTATLNDEIQDSDSLYSHNIHSAITLLRLRDIMSSRCVIDLTKCILMCENAKNRRSDLLKKYVFSVC